jgi:hypothetical protein
MYVYSGIVNQKIGFHTTGNSTSLSALVPFENFWEGTSVDKCEGRILG